MNKKFLKGLAVALFAGVALTAISAGVFADVSVAALPSEINQENDSATGLTRSNDVCAVGQTFTVSKDGTLDAVEVALAPAIVAPTDSEVDPSAPPRPMPRVVTAYAQIREVTANGNVNYFAPVLAESDKIVIDGVADAARAPFVWYTFDLVNPVDVEAGTQYAMVIISDYEVMPTAPGPGPDGNIQFQYTDDVYAGGTLLTDREFRADHIMDPNFVLKDSDYDMLFAAWVTPAVNPVVFNAGDHGKLNTDQVKVTDIVAYGTAATVPTVNVDSGYKFLGWVKTSDMTTAVTDFSNITSPLEVTALYEKLPELPKTGEGVMLISGLATLALGGGLVAFRRK